jgi:hypothetical protein
MELDAETDAKLKDVARRNFAAIKDSKIFLTLFNEAMYQDPICLMQMGLAVYLNKPVLLLVPEGAELPENLLMLAKKIEYFKRDPKDMASFNAAAQRLTAWMKDNT